MLQVSNAERSWPADEAERCEDALPTTARPSASISPLPRASTSDTAAFASLGLRIACAVALVVGDIISLIVAPTITLAAAGASPGDYGTELVVYALIAGLLLITAANKGHYVKRLPYWNQAQDLVKAFAFAALLQTAAGGILETSAHNGQLLLAWLLAFALTLGLRSAVKEVLLRINAWRLPTVIVGTGQHARETALALLSERHLGYQIIGFVAPAHTTEASVRLKEIDVPVRKLNERTRKWLERLGAPHVVIALEADDADSTQSQIDNLILGYPSISISPAVRGLPLFGATPCHFFSREVMLLEISGNLSTLSARFIKRSFDIIIASLLLVALSPLMLVIAGLIRQTGRTIIFSHERVGKNGRMFKCYKFRSMVENSREVLEHLLATDENARREWNADFKLKNDPRITGIGQFLRKSSLDELPQLLNVIKGDMSLVGPRPVIPAEIANYRHYASYYYNSRPGMTGLWQISGRNDIDYDSRVRLDVWYVSNWSFWNDLVILVRTVETVWRRSGAY